MEYPQSSQARGGKLAPFLNLCVLQFMPTARGHEHLVLSPLLVDMNFTDKAHYIFCLFFVISQVLYMLI